MQMPKIVRAFNHAMRKVTFAIAQSSHRVHIYRLPLGEILRGLRISSENESWRYRAFHKGFLEAFELRCDGSGHPKDEPHLLRSRDWPPVLSSDSISHALTFVV